MVMTAPEQNTTGLRFCGGSTLNDCRQSTLCRWGPDTGFPATVPHIMKTDGKTLLETGVQLALKTWLSFEEQTGFSRDDFDVFFGHQVGLMHRNLVYSALGLDISKDFLTYDYLGNTGSVALPLTFATGVEKGVFQPGMKAVLLGIGSGLVCTMYALDWQKAGK
jgi:3-oxoacyl-[acyl-carrier-protein] synthase-3